MNIKKRKKELRRYSPPAMKNNKVGEKWRRWREKLYAQDQFNRENSFLSSQAQNLNLKFTLRKF